MVHGEGVGGPLTLYDVCKRGVFGSRSAPGDLLRSACGRRVGILHFVGGARSNPLLARINASVLTWSGDMLRQMARVLAARPIVHSVWSDSEITRRAPD